MFTGFFSFTQSSQQLEQALHLSHIAENSQLTQTPFVEGVMGSHCMGSSHITNFAGNIYFSSHKRDV